MSLSLTDLGVTPGAGQPQRRPDSDEQWTRPGRYFRPGPEPVFAGDWLARMFDAGTSVEFLSEWLERFAWHRRALVPGDWSRLAPLDPLPIRLEIARTPVEDEPDRDRLLRLGSQWPLFDMPALRPLTRGRYSIKGPKSRFGDPPAVKPKAKVVAATSPLLVDRMHLASQATTQTVVLDVLAGDAHEWVRYQVASHPKVSDGAARALWADRDEAIAARLMSNPNVPAEAKVDFIATVDVDDPANLSIINHMRRRPDPRVADAWVRHLRS